MVLDFLRVVVAMVGFWIIGAGIRWLTILWRRPAEGQSAIHFWGSRTLREDQVRAIGVFALMFASVSVILTCIERFGDVVSARLWFNLAFVVASAIYLMGFMRITNDRD